MKNKLAVLIRLFIYLLFTLVFWKIIAEPQLVSLTTPNCEQLNLPVTIQVSEYCRLLHNGVSELFWNQVAFTGFAALFIGFLAAIGFICLEKYLTTKRTDTSK
jgi:hypothetical protein